MAAQTELQEKGPLGEVIAYFETAARRVLGSHAFMSEVISKKNVGEHLNEVFRDRAKMQAAAWAQNEQVCHFAYKGLGPALLQQVCHVGLRHCSYIHAKF